MTVMPSSPATSREALKMPDATPASAVGMAPSTIAVSGTDSPPPMPISAKLGISDRYEASRPSRLTEAMPTAISSIATPTTRCAPSRVADPLGDHRAGRHQQRHRHERRARLGRREAQHVLQVERGEEVDAEEPEAPHDDRDRRRRRRPAREQRDLDHRLGRCALRRRRRPARAPAASGEATEDHRRRPALVVALDERVGQREQRERRGDQTGQVDAAPDGRGIARTRRDRPQAEGHGGDADRDVDEEDPAPARGAG